MLVPSVQDEASDAEVEANYAQLGNSIKGNRINKKFKRRFFTLNIVDL